LVEHDAVADVVVEDLAVGDFDLVVEVPHRHAGDGGLVLELPLQVLPQLERRPGVHAGVVDRAVGLLLHHPIERVLVGLPFLLLEDLLELVHVEAEVVERGGLQAVPAGAVLVVQPVHDQRAVNRASQITHAAVGKHASIEVGVGHGPHDIGVVGELLVEDVEHALGQAVAVAPPGRERPEQDEVLHPLVLASGLRVEPSHADVSDLSAHLEHALAVVDPLGYR
jgi:hypothetical protein